MRRTPAVKGEEEKGRREEEKRKQEEKKNTMQEAEENREGHGGWKVVSVIYFFIWVSLWPMLFGNGWEEEINNNGQFG